MFRTNARRRVDPGTKQEPPPPALELVARGCDESNGTCPNDARNHSRRNGVDLFVAAAQRLSKRVRFIHGNDPVVGQWPSFVDVHFGTGHLEVADIDAESQA